MLFHLFLFSCHSAPCHMSILINCCVAMVNLSIKGHSYAPTGTIPLSGATFSVDFDFRWTQRAGMEAIVSGSNDCDLMTQCLLTVLNEGAMNPDERVSISYRQVGANVELI